VHQPPASLKRLAGIDLASSPFTSLVPDRVSMSTYLILSGLFVATGAIIVNTWRNAQATKNTSHVIYATENARKDS
jgi:hypothetical protein